MWYFYLTWGFFIIGLIYLIIIDIKKEKNNKKI